MPEQRGTFVLPRPPALPPTGVAGQLVTVDGRHYGHDGTKWSPLGGAGSPVRVVVDVGARGKREHTTTITADVSPGDRVRAWLDYGPTPAKTADEFELDAVDVWCAVTAAGRLLLRLVGLTGPIAGQFPITYAKG